MPGFASSSTWFPLGEKPRIEERRDKPNVTLDTTRDELTVHLERAFLVSVALPERPWISSDPLDELRGLATTAGAIVVGGLCQRREKINPNSYIGKGKLQELDRSELILDIFATRARTAEARLQVELAQLEYALPRLRQMWSHLGRITGGIGTRGPGETQ